MWLFNRLGGCGTSMRCFFAEDEIRGEASVCGEEERKVRLGYVVILQTEVLYLLLSIYLSLIYIYVSSYVCICGCFEFKLRRNV